MDSLISKAMRFLVVLILVSETVIKIDADRGQHAFLNSREFYEDLQPAESRYKVAAKPVPYKPPQPAPSHFEGVTPTIPVITKSQEFQTNDQNEFVPTALSHTTKLKNGGKSLIFKSDSNKGLSKVSLKEFLENKKKEDFLLEEEERILSQVKQHSKKTSPKTKYETDTVIYPTTTYRPQTFHNSDIAKELGLGSFSDKKNRKTEKLRNKKKDKKKKSRKHNSPSLRTLSDNRPSTYVESANYKPDLAYGVRKEKKKEKSGRRLRLKKVRRKKKYNNGVTSSGPGSQSNRLENSFRLKQKELKNKYNKRQKTKSSSSSSYNKVRSEDKESRSSKKSRYEKNWVNKQLEKKQFTYDKNNKLQLSSREKIEKPKKSSFKKSKISSSLFLEDSKDDRGTYKSVRRATKPPKYHGYDNIAIPHSNYAAPADHYGGITAYNALLSEFAPTDEDYPVITPAPITPNIAVTAAYGGPKFTDLDYGDEVLTPHEVSELASTVQKYPPLPAAKTIFRHQSPKHVPLPHHHSTPAPPPPPPVTPPPPSPPIFNNLIHGAEPIPIEHDYYDDYVDPIDHQPKPYAFTYGVKDYNSGTDFSRNEERTGQVTKGEYRTALPDGRIQIVSYVADHNGYKASVTYEGTPNYPAPGKPYTPSKDVFTVFPDSYKQKAPLPLPVVPEPAYAPPPHPSPKPAYVPPPPSPKPAYVPPPPSPKPAYIPPPPKPKPAYVPPPPKPKYQKFRHSNKVLDPFKVIDPYTKNGKVVGLDYDYYDYNDIYSSSKPTPKPTYQPYKPPPPSPTPKPYHPPPPTPTPKPVYESYAPPPPKQYHPVNAYKPAPFVVTTPLPAPVVTTTHASYAPPTPSPTPTYANAYSPSPSYTAPQPTLHHVNVQPASPPVRGLNFRDLPSPTESTFRGARKREVPGSNNKKSKLPTYPNFKPVFTTASSLLDYDEKNYDYNDYKDDYKEESVTLPSRINTVTATTPRPRVTSTTTPTYYPTTPSPSSPAVSPSASLLNSQKGFNTFTRTTTPPYTTNKLYITTPKPYYGGPWSPNYVETNYDSDLNSSPSHVTPSTVVKGSSKSSKITTYRPNGFTPTSLKYKKKQKNKQKYASSKSSKISDDFESSNTSSSSYDDSYDLGIDYYDYYYDAALDYLQGRISQLNSKNNNQKKKNSSNKHTNNNRYNKHKRPTKDTSKGKWNRRNVNNKNN